MRHLLLLASIGLLGCKEPLLVDCPGYYTGPAAYFRLYADSYIVEHLPNGVGEAAVDMVIPSTAKCTVKDAP